MTLFRYFSSCAVAAASIFFSCFPLAPAPALAQDNVLRVAFNDLPPWKIVQENGTCIGIDNDLVDLVATSMGLEVQNIPCPLPRCLKMMREGRADLMTGLLKRPEREEYMLFIEPAYKTSSDKAFYMTRGTEHNLAKYADLYSLHIGVESSSKYNERFDNDPLIIKDVAPSEKSNFLKLAKGRVDAVITTESSGDYMIRSLELEDLITKAPFGFRRELSVYMAISRKSRFMDRAGDLSERINRIVEENTLQTLKNRFLDSTLKTAADPD